MLNCHVIWKLLFKYVNFLICLYIVTLFFVDIVVLKMLMIQSDLIIHICWRLFWNVVKVFSCELIFNLMIIVLIYISCWGSRCGRNRMVVGFTTTYAISTYHHKCCEFESHSGDTTLCDKVCQWLATGQWFSPGTPISSTNKTDPNDITEILLKVALNAINQTKLFYWDNKMIMVGLV